MQRIERYGVIALVFLLVTILAVSLWGEGQDKARSLLASVRAGGEEVITPAARPGANKARAGGVRGPVASNQAPLSSPIDPQALTPRRRGRGKSPLVETAGGKLPPPRSASTPARPVPTPGAGLASSRPRPAVASGSSPVRRAQQNRTDFRRPPAGRVYTVVAGDSLSVIAQRELGTCKRWPEIAALNGNLDPARLQQGMVLRMPAADADAAKKLVAEAATPAPVPSAPAPAAAPVPVAGGSYTVRSGDMLSVISQRELGSAQRWREIVALNPGLDPDRLIVGARLRMPPSAAGAQAVAMADTRPARSADRAPRSSTRVR